MWTTSLVTSAGSLLGLTFFTIHLSLGKREIFMTYPATGSVNKKVLLPSWCVTNVYTFYLHIFILYWIIACAFFSCLLTLPVFCLFVCFFYLSPPVFCERKQRSKILVNYHVIYLSQCLFPSLLYLPGLLSLDFKLWGSYCYSLHSACCSWIGFVSECSCIMCFSYK